MIGRPGTRLSAPPARFGGAAVRAALLACWIGLAAIRAHATEAAAWQGLTVTGPGWQGVRPQFYSDFRYDLDARGLLGTVVRPGIRYDLGRAFTASLWYGHLELRPGAGAPRVDQERIELEATVRHRVTRGLEVSWRNRYEFRWLEGVAGRRDRFRTRGQATWDLPPGLPADQFFVQQEFLFSIPDGRLGESRTVPAGFTLRLGTHARLQLSWMHRRMRLGSGWLGENVAGTQLLIDY